MTLYAAWELFDDDLWNVLDGLWGDSGSILDDSSKMLDGASKEAQAKAEDDKGFLDGLKDWAGALADTVISVAGKAIPGPDIFEAIELYNKHRPEIEQALSEFMGDMSKAASELFGNPSRLDELGHAYQAAGTMLMPLSQDITTSTATLGASWSGKGFASYQKSTAKQSLAVSAVSTLASQAGDRMIEAGKTLRQFWSDLVTTAKEHVSGLVDIVKGMGSIFGILSFNIFTLFKAIKNAVNTAKNLLKAITDYMTKIKADAAVWDQLNSGQAPGFEGSK